MQGIGYNGAYDSVQRFVKSWKSGNHGPKLTEAFVPLQFQPGDACQFDWSQEQVELGGVLQTIKVAHFRMAYSSQMFVVAYPREMQEMVLDAHSRAFAFFGGVPARLIYDNLKTVVDAVYVGKERQFNRRFLTLANHYLFEPVACTPASGWEKVIKGVVFGLNSHALNSSVESGIASRMRQRMHTVEQLAQTGLRCF